MACRGRRKSRELTVETYGRVDGTAPVVPLIDGHLNEIQFINKPSSKRLKKKNKNKQNEAKPAKHINFISGNPFVEVTKGVLHVYKEK